MSSGPVLIVVPVLNRPHRIVPLLESIEASTPEQHRTLFITSEGQPEEVEALDAAGAEHIELPQCHGQGDYAKKVNFAYRMSDEPLIFLGADDLHFHPGWLPAALAKLTDGIGVVGTNDLGSPRVVRGNHATHSLVTRTYADQFGTADQPGEILHEGYWHEYVDDEFVRTAKARKAWAFAPDSHVEHLHPSWNKAPMDASYAMQRERMKQGSRLFRERRALWMSPS